MLKVAICDDEASIRAKLATLIEAQPYSCKIVEYSSAKYCHDEIGEIDLLFLDIELKSSDKGINGMSLARKIRAEQPGELPVIVFITGYERYVYEAFDVRAFQYLLKPVDEGKFTEVFRRAVARVEALSKEPGRALTIQIQGAKRTVPLEKIYYIESRDHKVLLRLNDGELSCYAKIGDLEKKLQSRFFRIHKGYLVNLSHISGYGRTEVELVSGEKLPLSKYKYQEFVKAYLRFMKEGIHA